MQPVMTRPKQLFSLVIGKLHFSPARIRSGAINSLAMINTKALIYQPCRETCADLRAGGKIRKDTHVICENFVNGQFQSMTPAAETGRINMLRH